MKKFDAKVETEKVIKFTLKEIDTNSFEISVSDDVVELTACNYFMLVQALYYVEDLISFCSDLRQYQINLNYMLSQVDKEICDIMHYIEFNSLDAANGYKCEVSGSDTDDILVI